MGRCVRVWLEAAHVGAKPGKKDKETVSSVCDGNKRENKPEQCLLVVLLHSNSIFYKFVYFKHIF